MQNMNTSDTIRHLHEQMQKDLTELHNLQEKLRVATEDMAQRGQEIPQLQRKIEEDRHEIYVDNSDINKVKAEIARIQREKILHEGALKRMENDLRNQSRAHEHSKLTK